MPSKRSYITCETDIDSLIVCLYRILDECKPEDVCLRYAMSFEQAGRIIRGKLEDEKSPGSEAGAGG